MYKQTKHRFIFSAIFVLLLLILFNDAWRLRYYLYGLGTTQGTLLVTLLFVAAAIGIFPPIAPIYMVCGAVLPFKNAVALCVLGNCLLFSLSYLVGKNGSAKISPIVLSLSEGGKKGFVAAFVLRGIRVVPCRMAGISMGKAKLPFVPYLLGSLLGSLPGVIFSVTMGLKLK